MTAVGITYTVTYMNTAANTATTASLLTFEDASNPPQTFGVLAVTEDCWGREFVLLNTDTNEVTTSDLRQAGWKLVAA